ncbi:glycoside-pentoside-hexuronide (GPH):cation symporter [Cellulomonas sp. NS3]|uniref:glycoside-pentoside-hexuronide (GPH):cation symporter n=1 Tax=Cellulomonas sp. NS3 TaxID=2973977 RepID=UPI002162A11B|nr:glycoside-pentoside-hexuronide (GPH):cation symporter [Cellulomonas sp. NS3]
MTTAIAEQQEAARRPLKWRALVGYSLGDFGCNLAFSLGSTFLLYYYTDVAGLTAATVGTMFFVVRLWDAFADIIAGRAVDRTMTRWGKFRPFILFFAVPLLFMSFLTFRVPTGLDDVGTLLYVYLTYAVLGLLYSLVNIPYGSLASAMTQSVHQRAKLVAARTLGAAAGGVLISYIIAPQISALRAQKDTLSPEVYLERAQAIFTNITLLFLVLGTIAFGLTFLWCHETVVRRSPSVTVKETFATLRQNRPLAILCGASFFYLMGYYTVTGATLYYATYILGDPGLAFQVALLSTGVQILITPFCPKLIARFGKKTLFQYAGFLTVVGGVGLFLTPNGMIWLALLCLGIKGVGFSLINTMMFALEPDTVEYGEWKTGVRSEGATYAIFSFTRKLTQSIGGAATAWALALGGYVSATTEVATPDQPESALLAIKVVFGLVPAVAAVLAMIVFITYPLTDQRFREVRDESEARKAALDHAVLGDRGAV